jgi:hypothetical protein
VNPQDELDRAFQVTPGDRDALRSGKIPPAIVRRLRLIAASSSLDKRVLLLVMVFPLGIALGLLSAPVHGSFGYVLLVTVALLPAPMFWVWLRDWRHEQRIFATRPPLRVLEGAAETIRTWQYGYGECYYLWADLKFVGQSHQPVCLFEKLGTRTLSGWARLFLATVPCRKGGLAPYYETPVAIEVRQDTEFVERQPARPPPDEPLRVNVPAD